MTGGDGKELEHANEKRTKTRDNKKDKKQEDNVSINQIEN